MTLMITMMTQRWWSHFLWQQKTRSVKNEPICWAGPPPDRSWERLNNGHWTKRRPNTNTYQIQIKIQKQILVQTQINWAGPPPDRSWEQLYNGHNQGPNPQPYWAITLHTCLDVNANSYRSKKITVFVRHLSFPMLHWTVHWLGHLFGESIITHPPYGGSWKLTGKVPLCPICNQRQTSLDSIKHRWSAILTNREMG